ncbi:DUF3488 domain-containing protein [Humitalea sp. 24SJ18S-53]|uniref:DUF3488 domain-containing protein n=1 Tax=Humitalea sp. 24SJ18S-53 TaxID=3422307 RepID=UPI003D6754CB
MTPPDHAADRITPSLRPARAGVAAPAARLAAVLALLPALFWGLIVLFPPLNHDVAAILNFSERWLAGEALYRDLIDVNPPLIFVLTLLPAAMGRWLPLDGPQSLLLCMLVLCGVVWRMTALLRRGRAEGPVEAAVLSAAIPLVLFVVGYDFAQREHLMGVVAIPYAILAARRADGLPTGTGLAIGTALLAAVGFALKPHFLAVPGLIELLVLGHRAARMGAWAGLRASLRDAVPWTMASVWLAYLVAIPVLFPDYFGYVLPLVWVYYLDLGVFGAFDVLLSNRLGTAFLGLAVLLPFAARRRAGALAQVLTAAAVGAFISAWVQHKGWSYHAAPILMLAPLAAMLLAARWADRNLAPTRSAATAWPFAASLAAMLALTAAYAGEAPWREILFRSSKAGILTAKLRQDALRERLLVLSPDIYPVYPALNYARAQSTLRTMNLWLLQGVYRECQPNSTRYRETWEMSRAEFFVYRTVAEDFAAAPPSVVLVAINPGIPWCNGEFDFLDYFRRHPLFDEAFSPYRQTGEVEGYRIYTRED